MDFIEQCQDDYSRETLTEELVRGADPEVLDAVEEYVDAYRATRRESLRQQILETLDRNRLETAPANIIH